MAETVKRDDTIWWVLGGLTGLVAAFFILRKANEVVRIFPVAPRSEPLTLPNTKQSFVNSLRAAIMAAMPQLSSTTVTLAIAQAAYESGYGGAVAYRLANNPWNVIVGGGYDYGGYTNHLTPVPGPDKDASNKPITQQWRHFLSYSDAARDWFGMLKRLWPTAYAKLLAGDSTYVTALAPNPTPPGNGNYYGLQPTKYQASYNTFLAEVQAL